MSTSGAPSNDPNRSGPPATVIRHPRRRVGAVVAVTLIGFVLLVSCYQCRYWVYPKRFGIVEPGRLFRSGQISRFLIEPTLEKYQIRTVVDLSGLSSEHPDQRQERECSQRLGIEHHRLPLKGDGTGDIESYAAAIEIIDHAQRAGEPVLVHCAAGSQRTGGVVAAYRLLLQRESVDRVLQELEAYDWSPDEDQVLLEYLDAHWGELVESLQRRGVLSSPPVKLPVLSSRK